MSSSYRSLPVSFSPQYHLPPKPSFPVHQGDFLKTCMWADQRLWPLMVPHCIPNKVPTSPRRSWRSGLCSPVIPSSHAPASQNYCPASSGISSPCLSTLLCSQAHNVYQGLWSWLKWARDKANSHTPVITFWSNCEILGILGKPK